MTEYIYKKRCCITDPPRIGQEVLVIGRANELIVLYRSEDDLWYENDGVESIPMHTGDIWIDLGKEELVVTRKSCTCPVFGPGTSDINNRIVISELHHAGPYEQPPWKYCPWCGGPVWRCVAP